MFFKKERERKLNLLQWMEGFKNERETKLNLLQWTQGF